MNTVFGQKKTVSQKFLTDGTRIPVTFVEVLPNTIVAVKTVEKDGYQAAQVGLNSRKNASNAEVGHAKKAKLEKAPLFLREVRMENSAEIGTIIEVGEVLEPGDIVDVTGTSKGKGFAGGVRRHHFRGGPRTHGQSDRERAPGSIGQTTTPGRVYKGKRMAGKMGFETVTIRNLVVVDVEGTNLTLKGVIPGIPGSLITVKKVGVKKNFVPMIKPIIEIEKTTEVTEEAVQEKVLA